MPVWMGIDLGEKRVGVALSDETLMIASAHAVIEFKSRKYLLDALQKIVNDYGVERVIVGLPITMKGELGPAAQKIKENVIWFEKQSGLPWVLWDERLTTAEAEKILLAADVSRSKRKEVRDRVAAQRILQSYLDAERIKGNP